MTKQFANIIIELTDNDIAQIIKKKKLMIFCDLKIDLNTKANLKAVQKRIEEIENDKLNN